MGQVALVQVEALGVGVALAGLTIDDEDSGDLGQLSKDDLVLILDPTHDAVLEEVTVPLIVLVLCQLYKRRN